MSKIKFLTLASLLLLLFNLGLIAFIIYGKKHPLLHEGPRNIIIEQLKFDKSQIAQYDTLISKHRKDIRAKHDEILQLRKELYQQLNFATNAKMKDSLSLEVGKAQTAIEHIHFAHFEDIKALCKDQQKQYFEQLTRELADYFNDKKLPKKKDK